MIISFFLRQDKRKLISKLYNVNGYPEKDSRKYEFSLEELNISTFKVTNELIF